MSNLKTSDKQILEKLFKMGGGYVLNFSDRLMEEFFRDDVGINIYDQKYNYGSGSKANYMRGFWNKADDKLVGESIKKLIEYIEQQILIEELSKSDYPDALMSKGREISCKLLGEKITIPEPEEDEFMSREFKDTPLTKLNLDGTLIDILEQRMNEIKKCIKARASLSVIFLCGSILEGILLGIATRNPKKFNESLCIPKDKNGKVKQFPDWTLGNFIDAAREINFIDEDVKKFSHALRDFRNYIHPYQQMSSGFNPTEHTAKICWQVLRTAIFQLSKKE